MSGWPISGGSRSLKSLGVVVRDNAVGELLLGGLRDGDRERLTVWTRSSTVQAGLAQRARTVLLAADG